MGELEEDIEKTLSASEDELKALVYHPSSKVIANLIHNRNLTEDLALVIANRKNIHPEILDALARDKRWKESYKIILAVCKNPKTPQKISLSLIKLLKIFDLADLTRNQLIPTNLRMRIEAGINEKLPGMPLGIKITLAKRASSNILIKLMEEGHKEVVAVCLDSPYLTEGDIYKIMHMKNISPQVVRMIAGHPKWSCRYQIRWALIRNAQSPLSCVVAFLKDMKTNDLKELYAAPEVPSSIKPFIYKELMEREGEV